MPVPARGSDPRRRTGRRVAAHAGDDSVCAIWAACCGYGDFRSMTTRTSEGYRAYAAILRGAPAGRSAASTGELLIVPAGRAFELLYNSSAAPLASNSTFSCLYHHALAGGSANCTLDSFGLGGHPSPLGTYLIACTFVATLLRQSPVGVPWAPEGVSDAQRDLMQRVAERAAHGAAAGHGAAGHGQSTVEVVE